MQLRMMEALGVRRPAGMTTQVDQNLEDGTQEREPDTFKSFRKLFKQTSVTCFGNEVLEWQIGIKSEWKGPVLA